jgi:hypothetical protein
MSKIVNVPLSLIDSNPSRLHAAYPFVEEKLDALRRSMQQDDVGCWAGIHARKVDGRYQIAFGHHRIRAASQIGLKEVPLIVSDLTDKQMVQWMGRENLDEYQTSFLVLLETWEAAVAFVSGAAAPKRAQPLDIARVLGWTRDADGPGLRMTDIANACTNTHKLIEAGHLKRDTLSGLSTRSAREIVERAQARISQLDKMAASAKRHAKEVEQAKRHIAKAVVQTAKDVKAGHVAQRDIRSHLDVQAYRHAKDADRATPLFAAFGKALSDSIAKMLNGDAASEKLQAVVESLGKIELDTDREIVKRLQFDMGALGERVDTWSKRLAAKPSAPATVSNLKLLKGN